MGWHTYACPLCQDVQQVHLSPALSWGGGRMMQNYYCTAPVA